MLVVLERTTNVVIVSLKCLLLLTATFKDQRQFDRQQLGFDLYASRRPMHKLDMFDKKIITQNDNMTKLFC